MGLLLLLRVTMRMTMLWQGKQQQLLHQPQTLLPLHYPSGHSKGTPGRQLLQPHPHHSLAHPAQRR